MEVGHKEFAKLVARCYERKVPLDVKGATGIGKSWVVKDEAQKIANQKKKKFVEWNEISDDQKRQLLKPELINKAFIFADIRLSQMDPSDLRGLPSLEGNTVEWKPNLIWKVLSNPEADGIVFFDEMNLSCPSIQASAYQIINDHQIGEIAISKNVFMISAGNRLCFKGDLLILGQDNQLIKEVKKGDKVFCKNGLGVVKDVMKRKYNGDMIKVRGRYLLPYEATPEHPIRVVPYKEKDTHTTTIKVFDNECWMTIKEVYDSFKQGNKFMLVVPRIKGIRGGKRGSFIPMVKYAKPKQRNQAFKHTGVGIGITMNQNIAWLMGLYLAEGWSSKTHVNFGLGAHETDIIKKLCGISNNQLKHKAFISKVRKGAVTVSICSSLLATAFKDWFGQGAKNKQIPWFVMQHKPNLIVKSFIRGYFDGDGSICKAPKTGRVQISATTVSKVLAIQLQLLTSSFGVIGSITVVKGGKDMIRGKPFNRSERYLISYNNTVMHTILGIGTDKKHKGNKFNYVKKDKILVPITKMSKEKYSGYVYNFETEDNTYLANNSLVHNCDRANVFEEPAPLKNRRINVTLKEPFMDEKSADDWGKWGSSNGVLPSIIAFLYWKPSYLYMFDDKSKDPSFPTPRMWHKASILVDGIDDLKEVRTLLGGAVGEGIAKEFIAFQKLKATINLRDLLKHPEKAAEIKELDMKYSIVSGIAELYKADQKILNEAIAVGMHMEPEFSMFMLRVAKGFSKSDFAAQLRNAPNWMKISNEYTKYLM